jgi:hypothetical protein
MGYGRKFLGKNCVDIYTYAKRQPMQDLGPPAKLNLCMQVRKYPDRWVIGDIQITVDSHRWPFSLS